MAGPGLAACARDSAAEGSTADTVENVGDLPGPFVLPSTTPTVAPATSVPTAASGSVSSGETTAPTAPAEPVAADHDEPTATTGSRTATAERFADDADGNRLLVLGDSISESIGPEFGAQLCHDLGARGWFVGFDAVQGRDIAAGLEALEDRLGEDQEWDGAIVNLGSNYRGDAVAYAADLRRILNLLRPRPVILVTATEWQPEVAEANYVIRDTARGRDGVWVVEWSERTRADDTLIGDDDLHLTDHGREALAALLAEEVGDAPQAAGSAFPACVLVSTDDAVTSTTRASGSNDEDD